METDDPSSNRPIGDARDGKGRFQRGHPGGPGNPFAAKVAKLRSALLNAVTEHDIAEVIDALKKNAKQGDVASIRELLSRCLGEPQAVDVLERLEALEAQLAKAGER
jgi:hypothetical protein